jgi:hypothetical protein
VRVAGSYNSTHSLRGMGEVPQRSAWSKASVTRRSQKKLCFGLWLGLVLVLPKSLAVTIKNIFMVYLQNYFNCSTLQRWHFFEAVMKLPKGTEGGAVYSHFLLLHSCSGGNDCFCARLETDMSASSTGHWGHTRPPIRIQNGKTGPRKTLEAVARGRNVRF